MSTQTGPSDPLAGLAHETVDERVLVVCTQTRQGRAAGREPHCSTTAIRWMNDLTNVTTAATNPGTEALSSQHRAPDGGAPVPLPPEGNRGALIRGSITSGPSTQYWRPGGVYVWRSNSKIEMMRHVQEMSWDARKQHIAVKDAEAVQRYRAKYEHALALHRAQPDKVPHPGPQRRYHTFLTTPLSDSTHLVEVTPSVLWTAGASQLKNTVLAPTERVWSMVGTASAAQLFGTVAGSVQGGQPGQLWRLLGRVTEDYQRRVEEQKKQLADREVQSRRSGEKAP
ncbi:hypothetical protein BKA62DRAFT_766061 [Auriculariales sp. MPI-PUGE-AT-0066]|nr:hypothetical protein BKA62DRAFT_766061 [Auriculariales sp. MPI-PUGE-AT-0066]